jgi:hypothetical protein
VSLFALARVDVCVRAMKCYSLLLPFQDRPTYVHLLSAKFANNKKTRTDAFAHFEGKQGNTMELRV